jgi:hypothetical protein
MDTTRDQVEMAKISIAYLMEGGTNARWVLDVIEEVVRGWNGLFSSSAQPTLEEIAEVQREWVDGEVGDPVTLEEILGRYSEMEVMTAAMRVSPRLKAVVGRGITGQFEDILKALAKR